MDAALKRCLAPRITRVLCTVLISTPSLLFGQTEDRSVRGSRNNPHRIGEGHAAAPVPLTDAEARLLDVLEPSAVETIELVEEASIDAVVEHTAIRLPYQGIAVFRITARLSSGELRSVVVDEHGLEVDLAELQEIELLAADAGREVLEGMEDFRPTRVMSRDDFRARKQAVTDDLEQIDNGDGTWSYALPEDFDPDVAVVGRLVTWRYVGQARFSHDPKPPTSIRHHVVQHEVQRTNQQKLARMKRIDSQGRIWCPASIDVARWEEIAAPDPVELEDEDDSLQRRPHSSLEMEPAPGTVISWQPMSWVHYYCDSFSGTDLHLWDGESRSAKFPSSLTDRQKTAVQILTNGLVSCSGVILTESQILTAAHCVSDDSNNPVPTSTVQVCRYDTGNCRNAADIDFSGSYGGGSGSGGGTDFADDWAIIELSGSWSSTAEDMDLSSASDTKIENLSNLKNLAFPQFASTCGANNGSTLYYNKETEPVASVTTKKLKMKIDGSPGHSGSPIYYCPEGNDNTCTSDQTGFVIAVFAGWNPVSNRHVGPKVPNFRSAAIAFITD